MKAMILYSDKEKKESKKIYKEHNFNTQEIDTVVSTYFTILITALYNNLELWKTFIKRNISYDVDWMKNKKLYLKK